MDFYENEYGKREDTEVVRVASDLLSRYVSCEGPELSLLDVGCGNMQLAKLLVADLQTKLRKPCAFKLTGWDISQEGVKQARAAGFDAHVVDITKGVEESEKYDVILLLEVIEHVVDTDQVIRNVHQLLRPNGLLVLSTPNLASWYNRIFLLFGMQPHCTEVSFEKPRFGNWLTQKLIGGGPAGHLRVFTLGALKAFLRYHHFDTLSVKGISNHKPDVISKLFLACGPRFAGDVCLLARKA